jgi:predicted amidophosphoribosyltransferase
VIQIESRNIVVRFRQWWLAGVDLIFPSRCAGCGGVGSVWCENCDNSLRRISKPFCDTCGKPVTKPVRQCNHCIGYPPGLRVRAFARYQGPLMRAILHLKYRPNRELARIMSSWLNNHLSRVRGNLDLIIPVPLGRRRLRSRGYNQAGLLA